MNVSTKAKNQKSAIPNTFSLFFITPQYQHLLTPTSLSYEYDLILFHRIIFDRENQTHEICRA